MIKTHKIALISLFSIVVTSAYGMNADNQDDIKQNPFKIESNINSNENEIPTNQGLRANADETEEALLERMKYSENWGFKEICEEFINASKKGYTIALGDAPNEEPTKVPDTYSAHNGLLAPAFYSCVIVYGYSLSPKQSAILIKGLFWSVKNNHIDFFNNLLQKTQPLTIDRHQISRIAETEENFISVALIDKKYDFIKSMIDSNFVRKYQQFFKIANVNKIYDYFFEENDCLHFMKFNIFPTAEQIVVYVEDEYKLIEKNIKSKNSENLKIIIKNYIYGTYYIHKSIESILTYAKDHKDIDLLTLTLENHLKKRLSTFPEFLSKKLITDSLSVLKEYNPELSDVFLKDYTDSWAKEDLRNSWLLKGYTELSVADRKKLFNTNSREKEGLQESSSQKGWCVIS